MNIDRVHELCIYIYLSETWPVLSGVSYLPPSHFYVWFYHVNQSNYVFQLICWPICLLFQYLTFPLYKSQRNLFRNGGDTFRWVSERQVLQQKISLIISVWRCIMEIVHRKWSVSVFMAWFFMYKDSAKWINWLDILDLFGFPLIKLSVVFTFSLMPKRFSILQWNVL